MPNMVLVAALGCAKEGLPVFPVNPRTKKPYLPRPQAGGKGGFHQATTDAKQIERWWRQYPDAMLAIPCGERSGIWVLDPDNDPKKGIDGLKAFKELIARNTPLPPTRVCITPRGGRHYQWQCIGDAKLIRNSDSEIAPGIDVRGNGGYEIIPPSVRADGTAYRWENGADLGVAPDWLIKLALNANKKTHRGAQSGTAQAGPQPSSSPLSSPQPSPQPTNKRTRRRSQLTMRALAALDQEYENVASSPPGKRNHTLNTAAFNLGQLIASGELDENEVRARLYAAAVACGAVADDGAQQALDTINSGLQGGIAKPRARQARQGSQPRPMPGSQPSPTQGPPSGLGPPPPPGSLPSPQPQPQPQPRPRRRRYMAKQTRYAANTGNRRLHRRPRA